MKKNISVLLSVKDGEQYIHSAVKSILTQTYKDFELIIINDGSTDKTVEIINSFNDPRINIIHTQGLGLPSALNLGLKKCSGKYIARMDADDICMPERFKEQKDILDNHNEIGVVCSDVEIIDKSDNTIGLTTDIIVNKQSLIEGLTLERKMKPIVHPSVMIRKNLLEKVNGYRKYNTAQDRDLWLRLVPYTNFYRIRKPLLKYRITDSNMSNRKYAQQKTNSLLAILNYKIKKNMNIDLYRELPKIHEHFYKSINMYVVNHQKEFILVSRFKKDTKEASFIKKVFVLLLNKNRYYLLKYIFYSRRSDVNYLNKLHDLFEEFNNITSIDKTIREE